MNTIRKSIAAALLAACCASTFAAGQAEAPPADGDHAAGQGPRRGPEGRGPEGRGPEGRGPEDGPRHGPGGPGFGHRFGHLKLSEAQQDKLFAIEHAAAPQRREQEKAIRRAHEALGALRDAAQFDEARAGAASRELGQAIAAETLLEARLHAQLLAVLTPEQREQLRQRRPQAPQERP
ncbi:Spy/CpxP family protein refolding chaperone [Massilia aerilata]|uniref:Spy/CpxP family protein refolding chaperone n=1 Tax=Massilia aerilata TaxID=453817 RepID=A0ABW0RRH4_9BURK